MPDHVRLDKGSAAFIGTLTENKRCHPSPEPFHPVIAWLPHTIGISLDLWRVINEQRRLQGVADGAALAGASALDIDAIYDSGIVVLAPDHAAALACDYIAERSELGCARHGAHVTVADDAIVVHLETDVVLSLLRLIEPAGSGLVEVAASAHARPVPSG